jgi:hypothetical protein
MSRADKFYRCPQCKAIAHITVCYDRSGADVAVTLVCNAGCGEPDVAVGDATDDPVTGIVQLPPQTDEPYGRWIPDQKRGAA